MAMKRMTPQKLQELRERCLGQSGGDEAESDVYWRREDARRGFVEVYSSRGADIVKIIDRCGSAITHYEVRGDSVYLKIQTRKNGKKVFRGIQYAFAPVDVDGGSFPKGGE